MEKVNPGWNNLGFPYIKTPLRYVSYWRDGKWEEGMLTDNNQLTVSEGSSALHYGQQCFEGLEAYQRTNGSVNLFRPDENVKRLQKNRARLLMSQLPVETSVFVYREMVKASLAYLSPYGIDDTLYLRLYMIGAGDNIGVAPTKEYIFSIFCVPTGSYSKNGLASANLIISEYDRVASRGIGAAKAGGNYIASLLPDAEAREKEFNDCIYLDSYTHMKIEEAGVVNLFGITKDGTFITSKSMSILPSITKYPLLTLAKERLGITALEGDIYIDRLAGSSGAGACGAAVIISPIGGIQNGTDFHVFYSETGIRSAARQLYDELVGIQSDDKEAPEGWIVKA